MVRKQPKKGICRIVSGPHRGRSGVVYKIVDKKDMWRWNKIDAYTGRMVQVGDLMVRLEGGKNVICKGGEIRSL